MEKTVNMVAEKAGISEAQAQTAVTTVANFLKDKMPSGMASRVDTYLQGEGPAGDSGGMADKLGGTKNNKFKYIEAARNSRAASILFLKI